MRPQLQIAKYVCFSEKFGEYNIEFYGPACASVHLVSYTGRPVWTMATTTNGYNGVYELNSFERGEVEHLFKDIQSTKLQTPLEMVHMVWLLEDVSRAFTHQLVRYRVGTAFIQESMRFLGMKNTYKVLVTHLPLQSPELTSYMEAAKNSIQSYVSMLEKGVPAEDARGVLPTNILTRIFFDCSLRTLQGIFPQRLCCQAQQGEWQPILLEMRKIIAQEMGQEIEELLRAPYELGHPCGYRASFDRPCVWQKEQRHDSIGVQQVSK